MLKRAEQNACGNIAVAVDEFLATGQASAVSFQRNQTFLSTIDAVREARHVPASSVIAISGRKELAQEAIVAELRRAGDGVRGIVAYNRGRGTAGHFVNVQNIGGEVWFFDAGLGIAATSSHPNAFLAVCDNIGSMAIPNENGIRLILTGR